jgi:hypothetical protein
MASSGVAIARLSDRIQAVAGPSSAFRFNSRNLSRRVRYGSATNIVLVCPAIET